MKQTPRPHKKFASFSFLEVLIAITMLSTIMVFLFLLTNQTQQNQVRSLSIINARQEKRILRSILQSDIKKATYLYRWAGSPQRVSGFYGLATLDGTIDVNQIFFHAKTFSLHPLKPLNKKDPGIHEVGYYLKKNAQTNLYSLYRREYYFIRNNFSPIVNLFDETINTDPREYDILLYDKMTSFKVRYLPQIDATAGEWAENWESKAQARENKLPLAVLVEYSLLDADNQPQTDVFQVNLNPILPVNSAWGF